MRFSTASVLGLAASTAAAVLPRSQLGSWDVSFSRSAYANGYSKQTITAVYTSDSYPEGITSSCTDIHNPTVDGAEDTHTCSEGFSYSYHVQTVSLSQVVQEPSPNTTVFGTSPITVKSDASGRTFTADVTVEVTHATA